MPTRVFSSLLCCATALLCLLTACDRPVDPARNNITADQIRSDLAERRISGLEGGEFLFAGPCYIVASDVTYSGRRASAKVLLRALNLAGGEGVAGELKLDYVFRSEAWQLEALAPVALERMPRAWAERLVQLVDSPLHFAASIGDLAGVAAELERGAAVDAPEERKLSTPLMFAAERGFLEIVTLLVERGADLNHHNRFGFTPLHAAANGSHPAVVELLLARGAAADPVDSTGRTPLYFAAERDSLAIARSLVERGADPNAADLKHWTPLYAAAEHNALAVARYLLEHGARVNLGPAGASHSPLLIAAFHGHREMVELLLAAGADPAVRLSKGHGGGFKSLTAAEIARQQGHVAVAELLDSRQTVR